MAMGRGNAANEAAILRVLLTDGQTPCSMFTIVYTTTPGCGGQGKRKTGIGGAATLKRLMDAKLVQYPPDHLIQPDTDPMVEITDEGIEALRAYRAGETQGIVRAG